MASTITARTDSIRVKLFLVCVCVGGRGVITRQMIICDEKTKFGIYSSRSLLSLYLRPRSHCSVFVMIRFCCIDATRSLYAVSVQTRRGKDPFLSVDIDPSDSNTEPNISFFMRSHYSISVKLIVEYWSVFKNLRFVPSH